MRRIRALVITLALTSVVAACAGTQPGGSGDGSEPATPTADAGSGSESPSASGAASPSGAAVGEDCEEHLREFTGAASELSLTWESIDYSVLDDTGWQQQVDQDWVDPVAYRAAAELLQDIPDYEDEFFEGVWSTHAGAALELADLLDQATESGTPFADGIGEQIREQAVQLRQDAGTLVHFTVDHMCDDPADEVAAGGVDELVAALTPPNGTETDRLTSPEFSTFEFESSDSLDSLKAFYDATIPTTGYDVFYADALGDDGWYWDVQGDSAFRWQVSIRPSTSGSGNGVSLSFYGAP